MSNTVNQQIPDTIFKALKGSGFPFQTAVAHVINSCTGWSVYASEYPWRGPDNDEHFLDTVGVSKRFFVTVECKKTSKESFTFLRPLAGGLNEGNVDEFRCLQVVDCVSKKMGVRYKTGKLWPSSPSCEFCIVGGSSGKERLLERDAGLVVGATDAFANDFDEYRRSKLEFPYLVLPVIVTNAKLYVARYNPSEVSLESGEFEKQPTEMENDVPWIRFSKTLIAGRGRDVGYRSIFVVQSMHLKEFLEHLEEAPGQDNEQNGS